MNTYEMRLKRTLDAVEMKPVDKIPFSYSGSAYVARRQGLVMKDFISDFPRAIEATVGFLTSHPGIDSIHSPIMCPHVLTPMWLSKVKVPGVELSDDELWQVDEREVLSVDDYDKILEVGYEEWVGDVLKNRLDDPIGKAANFFRYMPDAFQKVAEAGVPVVNAANFGSPLEGFCGGRTLAKFFLDLYDMPELVKKAFDKAQEYLLGSFVGMLKAIKPIAAWVGGWRCAPDLMSPDTWREYAWAYIKPAIYATLECGVLPILHFDSNWDNAIETLKELPPRKCVLMLDGKTDIRRARAILDDRMCILGDVPPTLLAFGTADEVYNYTTKLIDDVGPKSGLIVSTGCDNPPNAVHENVDAMIQATIDYKV
ncbi:MAG: methyltransferase [Oscillospiraceae bacterium]|nr:methyltransferase [Oscillospiraceae bacterium]